LLTKINNISSGHKIRTICIYVSISYVSYAHTLYVEKHVYNSKIQENKLAQS